MTVTIPVAKVETMLDAKYSVYEHVVRTTSYSLPDVLHEHVSVITPTTYFGIWRPRSSVRNLSMTGSRHP